MQAIFDNTESEKAYLLVDDSTFGSQTTISKQSSPSMALAIQL